MVDYRIIAKLSARGRTELARVEHERHHTLADNDQLSWSRKTVVLMSDRAVLEKYDVVFRRGDERYSYGWKKLGRAKPNLTPEQFVEVYASRGFKRV